MGGDNGSRLMPGRGMGRKLRKGSGRGMGTGTAKGLGLLNKPQGENVHSAVENLQGARVMGHGGLTRVGIFTAGSITRRVHIVRCRYKLYRPVGQLIFLRT